MSRRVAAACTLLLPMMAATAAEVLSPHLAGIWGTAESLYAGDTGQAMLYLQADGWGMMAGSTKPAVPLGQAVSPPQHAPRAIIGFAVRALQEGEAVTLTPVMPGHSEAVPAILCRHDDARQILTCENPKGFTVVLKRQGDAVPPEVVRTIDQTKSAASAAAK